MLQNKLHVFCCPFCCSYRKKLFPKWWTCIGEEEGWSWEIDKVGAYAPKIAPPLHMKKKMLNRFCLNYNTTGFSWFILGVKGLSRISWFAVSFTRFGLGKYLLKRRRGKLSKHLCMWCLVFNNLLAILPCVEACVVEQLTPPTLDLDVSGSSLAHHAVSSDKEYYASLSLFSQVYKWVPAIYCWGVTLRWTRIPSRGE